MTRKHTLVALIPTLTALLIIAPSAHAKGGFSWSGETWHVAVGTFASGQKNLASNVSVSNGHVFIQIRNKTGGGIGGSLNRSSGTWAVTFRMTKGAGKYAIGLWPANGSRPEVDFAEDSRGDPSRNHMTGTYHPLPGCTNCIHSSINGDFTQWHTASVTYAGGGFTLKLDGHTWAHYSSSYRGAMHIFIHAEAWNDTGTSTLEIASVDTGSSTATPAVATQLQPISHVILLMEENHNINQVTPSSMPYLSSLGSTYAKATHLSAIGHPSLPNYFAITSGSTQGKSNDCGSSTAGCTTGADNIFHQTNNDWAQWSEAMPSACDHTNAGAYVVHHAIPPFYTDLAAQCPASDQPFSKGAVPVAAAKYTFITPDNLDNAHSASLGAADSWLKVVVPKLLSQLAYKNGSTLLEITFDEGADGSNIVYTAFINPRLSHVVVTEAASHYSTLRLNEELLGFPLLAGAKTAPDLRPALGL